MHDSIMSDLYRWVGSANSLNTKYLIKYLMIPQFRFIYLKRKCEIYKAKNKLLFLFYSLIYKYYKIKYNMDFPAKVVIGRGFMIEHIGGIVINPAVKFGNNINIYNGVTIGVEKRGKRKGVPTIGNRVWIGSNSVLVGKIRIYDDVLIAPGAYVNFDVPSHSIVIGNPGKIIHRENATNVYIDNCYLTNN